MRHRLKPLAFVAVAALMLHVAVLGGWQWAWPQRTAPVLPAAAMQVRAVVVVGSREPAAEAATPVPAPVQMPMPMPMPALRPAVTKPAPGARAPAAAPPVLATRVAAPAAPAEPGPSPSPSPSPSPIPAVTLAGAGEASPPEAAPRESTPPTAREPTPFADEAIPHYRTRLPPAALLRYELTRGALSGTGELLWQPADDHYELRLDGRVGPLAVLTQVSSGAFDAAGLAPLRFTEKRLRRPTTAANFQREAGKITFSGPATEFALHEGTQDRLSWMVQLAAIVAAEPALRSAGATVVMRVVGAHADASVWAFRCIGREPVDTEGGAVDAIKYLREPRDLHDTTVQVWLDPARHFLPVHATQKSGPGDEGFALRLREIVAAP